MKVSAMLLLLGVLAIGAYAQRPRTMEPSTDNKATPAPAPQSVKAKYEGGVFGHNKAMDGTLTLDDTNHRLLFGTKEKKDVLFIPYDAVTSAFADTQKRQPAAASVASAVPLIYSLPAHFIKTKVRYLTVQFRDPDTRVSGITSFRLENKDILASVLAAVAEKASLTQRGDVYVKKTDTDSGKLNP